MNRSSSATARSEISTQPAPLVKEKKIEKKRRKYKRKNRLWSLVTNVPELSILIMLIVGGYILMGVFSKVESSQVLSAWSIWWIIVGSFLISTAIATLAVIGGIGGGVIFTPIMLGFTSLDSLVIRATGLVVAMFSGLVSTGPFMKTKLADIKLVFYCGVPITVGALAGSVSAIYLHEGLGDFGDGLVRDSHAGRGLVFV